MKNLLNLDKIMNKKQINMERMAVLVVLAYTIGLLIGEQIRDQVHGGTKKMEAVFWSIHAAQAEGPSNQRSVCPCSGLCLYDLHKNCLSRCPNSCLNVRKGLLTEQQSYDTL